jgi:hypothetical protein
VQPVPDKASGSTLILNTRARHTKMTGQQEKISVHFCGLYYTQIYETKMGQKKKKQEISR